LFKFIGLLLLRVIVVFVLAANGRREAIVLEAVVGRLTWTLEAGGGTMPGLAAGLAFFVWCCTPASSSESRGLLDANVDEAAVAVLDRLPDGGSRPTGLARPLLGVGILLIVCENGSQKYVLF
jgi:hypothetical protein